MIDSTLSTLYWLCCCPMPSTIDVVFVIVIVASANQFTRKYHCEKFENKTAQTKAEQIRNEKIISNHWS